MMRDAVTTSGGGGGGGGGGAARSNPSFDKQQFDSSKPVFNRAGFNKAQDDSSSAGGGGHSNLPSKAPKNTNSPSAMRVIMAGSPKKTPKGVVLPPEGAYM